MSDADFSNSGIVSDEGSDNEETASCSTDITSDSLPIEVVQQLPYCTEEISFEDLDNDDCKLVDDFLSSGCGCQKWKGKSCSMQFNNTHVLDVRLSMRALTRDELDLVVMGQLMAGANISESVSTKSYHRPAMRQKAYTSFFHQGKPICQSMFVFLHCIGLKRLKNLSKFFQAHGIAPRLHGNIKRLPANTLSFQSVKYVVKFLSNYVEQHGLLLPGRVPGYKKDDIKLLPSSTSKKNVWKTYLTAAQVSVDVQAVAYLTFCSLWSSLLPSIVVMQPMTDLCWTCQKTVQLFFVLPITQSNTSPRF